jgi:hypothetical protein
LSPATAHNCNGAQLPRSPDHDVVFDFGVI